MNPLLQNTIKRILHRQFGKMSLDCTNIQLNFKICELKEEEKMSFEILVEWGNCCLLASSFFSVKFHVWFCLLLCLSGTFNHATGGWMAREKKEKLVERQIKWISISGTPKSHRGVYIYLYVYAQYVECKMFHTCSNRFEEIDPAGSPANYLHTARICRRSWHFSVQPVEIVQTAKFSVTTVWWQNKKELSFLW